tara:strand:+ start:503 stop:1072 length:570 start_codon:yes stop_codon:yes gene_type:complete
MIQKEILYSLPVLIGNVSDVKNEILIENVLKQKDDKLNQDKLNTSYEDTYIDECEELVELFNKIQDDMWDEKGLDLDITSWWAHIQEPNMSTFLHNHLGDENHPTDLAGVYYPHNPHIDSGEIVFQWPDLRTKWGRDIKKFTPKEGMYLIFPCHLDHWITRNTSTENRISISFNMEIMNKEKKNKWELL